MSNFVLWSNAKTSPSNSSLKQVVHITVDPILKQSLTAAIFNCCLPIFGGSNNSNSNYNDDDEVFDDGDDDDNKTVAAVTYW